MLSDKEPPPSQSASSGDSTTNPAKFDIILESLNTITGNMSLLSNEISEIKTQNNEINRNINNINNSLSSLKQELNKVKEENKKLSKENNCLKSNVFNLTCLMYDNLQYTRYNRVRISNVPVKENENLFTVIQRISEKIEFNLIKENLDNYYRVPSKNKQFEPSIMIKFSRNVEKMEFIKAYKNKRKAEKGKFFLETTVNEKTLPVYISEAMSPFHYRLFKKLKEFRGAC